MATDLEIPQAANDRAWDVFAENCGEMCDDPASSGAVLWALQAAASLVVAAELDRIGPELTSAVCSKTDEWDAGWWAALEWVGQQLGRRASELRGEDPNG